MRACVRCAHRPAVHYTIFAPHVRHHCVCASLRFQSKTTYTAATTTAAAAASHHHCDTRTATPRHYTKRTNYADMDRVLAHERKERTADAEREVEQKSAATGFLLSSSSSSFAKVQHTPFLTRFSQLMWLKCLDIPLVGHAVVTLWGYLAYPSYMIGQIRFFSRPTVAPPLGTKPWPLDSGRPDGGSCSDDGEHEKHAGSSASTFHINKHLEESIRLLVCSGEYGQAAELAASTSAAASVVAREAGGNTDGTVTCMQDVDSAEASSSSFSFPSVVPSLLFRDILQAHTLPCVYISRSDIHGRGLFTSCDLSAGTRVLALPRRAFMLSSAYLRLLSDTHERLPDVSHYTHPTGQVVELVLQAQPQHLLNHSCNANLCTGLSPLFWDCALACDDDAVKERITTWEHFEDANSYFTTRPVKAGEELLVDYGARLAPLYAGEKLVCGHSLITCKCGEPQCRHFLYSRSSRVQAYLSGLQHKRNKRRNVLKASEKEQMDSNEIKKGKRTSFEVARDLIGLGFDDELVILSLLPDKEPLVAYLNGDPIPELCFPSSNSTTFTSGSINFSADDGHRRRAIHMETKKAHKAELLQCERHVFKLLNEASPQKV